MKTKEQIKKGCGKKVLTERVDKEDAVFCGGYKINKYDDSKSKIYCNKCEAKVSIIQDYEKEILEMIKNLKNPYPEDVFLPVSKEEYTAIHNLLLKKFNIPLDRVSADLMRIARKILKEELISKIKE